MSEPIHEVDHAASRPWRSVTLGIGGALLALALIVGIRHVTAASSTPAPVFPATPAAWVQQFTAAAIDDPSDVCRRLFSPALAAVFRVDTGKSCLRYYSRVESQSYRIRHTLQDGPSAAVEAQQLGQGRGFGYFTIVLGRLPRGWQAIDIVPGGSVRPR